MAVTINSIPINPSILDQSESNLVQSSEMTRYFGLPQDYIQLLIYNNTNTLLRINNNFLNYSVNDNKEINFEPAIDIENAGFRLGTYKMVYNFLRPILIDTPNLNLFIKSISADRTEIKLASSIESNDVFYANTVNYITLVQSRDYFIEFYLNFGNNNLIPALSIAAEQDIIGNSYAIIKLLDPLPQNYTINSPLNVVEKIVDTKEYQAVLTANPIVPQFPSLREANFSLDVDSVRIGSSDYYNYNQIITQTGSNSQFQQLLGYISASNPRINVDYTNYSNFIHFGSAVQILETFKNQLEKIQIYEGLRGSLPSTDPNYIIYTSRINEILQQFNGYENYLYNESGSLAWPKYPGDKPYTNYSVTSSQAIIWYNQQYESASYYDEFNNDYLVYGLPAYLQESPTFDYVKPFVNSMGQLFDDIWIYIKAMTDLWKAENSLNDGISKDLVADALQSLGIHLYTDGDQDNLYEWLYGVDSSGSYFFPTQSWQTGVTASKYTMSGQDEAKSIFKRLYANLPTLLKSKGTDKFINYLNTLFGIPDTILFPMEFGGIDKSSNTAEYNYSRFTSALQFSPYRYTYIDNTTSNPYGINGLEFRFKPTSLNTSSIQTLLISANHTTPSPVDWGFILTPTSVNGYNYANVTLYNNGITSSVSLPIFVTNSDNNYNWWNVAWQNEGTGSIFYVKNELNGEIGFSVSASHPSPIYDSIDNRIELGNVNTLYSTTLPSFFGSGNCYCQLQELRGWTVPLNELTINAHTLNPESYIGNTTSSAYDNLLFRFPLGNDLYTNFGIVTGSQPQPNSNYFLYFYGTWNLSDYVNFTEQYYTQPAVGGYSVPNTDKIRIESQTLATNRLQPLKSVVYNNPTASRTTDIHLTQVGFSPQDQINNDIIAQLGNTYNLDQIIGDPRFSNLNYYPGLEPLQEEYFEKYIASYNYKDFIQLIETFHKSLFRYLEDYVPGRSNNATGVVIKPHILERSKTRRYEPTINTASYDGQTWTVTITGSNPGGYCCSRNSPFNEAFFDGEFSGSLIAVNDYYEQNNPFTRAICDCHRYQVTSDQGFLYVGCNGEIKLQSIPGPNYEVNQIYACSGSNNIVFPLGGQPLIQDLGRFADNQAFVEQYEGWDALDNNVEQNVVSQFKKSKQPSLQDLFGPCVRTYVNNPSIVRLNVQYVDCNGNTKQKEFSTFDGGYIEGGTIQDSVVKISGPISFEVYYFENINTQVTSSYEWQDTYLSDTGYLRTREIGSSTTSSGFNLNMISSSIGEVPNVEQTIPYMLYYDWTTSSLAERDDSYDLHIRYLIDETGSVFNPNYTSSYYWNVDQGFGNGTPIQVSLLDPLTQRIDTVKQTTSYRPLKTFQPIVYSDVGTQGTNVLVYGYSPTITFNPIKEFNQKLVLEVGVQSNVSYSINNNGYIPPFDVIYRDTPEGWSLVDFAYTAPENSVGNVRITLDLALENFDSNASDLLIDVLKDSGGVTSVVGSGAAYILPGEKFDFQLPSPNYVETSLLKGDKIYAYIQKRPGSTPAFTRLKYNNPTPRNWITKFTIDGVAEKTQFDPATPNYFTKTLGSNTIAGSFEFSRFYDAGFAQQLYPKSGFKNALPFTIQKYDQIRFESNEKKVYTIMSSSIFTFVNPSTLIPSRSLRLHLDRIVEGDVDVNYFTIRRLVDDPSFIIVNNMDQAGTILPNTPIKGPGFVIPKYPTSTLENNIPKIITKLSSEGLIP
jgi:hypothetical protein